MLAGSFDGFTRWVVVGVALFMGVGAIGGGVELLDDAEGFGMQEAWLSGSPFSTYRIPGLFLAIVIGGGMLSVAGLTLARHGLAGYAALAMGAMLLLWLVIETVIIGLRGSQQTVLLVVCGGSGILLSVVGGHALTSRGALGARR